MRSALVVIVVILLSGSGSDSPATQRIQTDPSDELRAPKIAEKIVNDIVACLERGGFPMQKEVRHDGQVVNWVLTDRSSDCCRVKTSFRAFASRAAMEKSMMATNLASVLHDELDVAMFVPWATRTREDCEAACSTSFEDELVSAFRACDGREEADRGRAR